MSGIITNELQIEMFLHETSQYIEQLEQSAFNEKKAFFILMIRIKYAAS